MLRNRLLGGVMPLINYAPDDGTGAAGAGAGAAGGVAAAGAAGTGAAAAAAGAASGAGQAGTAGAAAGQGAGATGATAGAAGATAGAAGATAGAAGATGAAALASGAVTDPAKPIASPADWPADWREKAAAGDTGFLNQLKRYTDPVAALNWVRTQSLKISAGELRPVLKPDASPEEIAEYRKANGVPEKADGYVTGLKLPDGLVTGEADKPLLESFAATALAKGIPQETYNTMVGWFFEQQNLATAQRAEADKDHEIAARDELIKSMGADFKPNMNALKAFWRDQPPELIDTVLGARSPDGRVIGNITGVTQWLAGIARELNPGATLLPAGGEQGAQGVANRIKEIDALKYIDGKQNPQYFGGPLFKEYQDLIAAQERMKTRAA